MERHDGTRLYYSVLTNGETTIPFEMVIGKGYGIYPPSGVVVGVSGDGKYYINGKRAWIEYGILNAKDFEEE